MVTARQLAGLQQSSKALEARLETHGQDRKSAMAVLDLCLLV
jgi:hypothetical protein